MDYKDYYDILGLKKGANDKEIKAAYRKLALKYHPDRNSGDKAAEEKFKEVNEAHQVLSNSEKRSHYDRLGSAYSHWEQGGQQKSGFDWGQWGNAEPGNVRVEYSGDFGEGMDGLGGFSDFFQQIFGQMGGFGNAARSPQSIPGQEYEQDITISLEEAFRGSSRQLNVNGRKLDVKIPAGARTGTKVRMRGAGPTAPGGQSSDIILVVEVAADPRFKRKGRDLQSEMPISLYTAVLGGESRVATFNGNVVLTIPAGTQSGQTFRLSGKGMPKLKKPDTFGDLLVSIKVRIPKELSDKEKNLFEQLARLGKQEEQ